MTLLMTRSSLSIVSHLAIMKLGKEGKTNVFASLKDIMEWPNFLLY